MIFTLKKLEAGEGDEFSVVDQGAARVSNNFDKQQPAKATERELLAVPKTGWLDGPGRMSRYA